MQTWQVGGAQWTHVVASVKKSGSSCTVSLIVNGQERVGQTAVSEFGTPSHACTSAAPDEFGKGGGTLGGLTMRIGHRMEGSINDVIIHNKVFTPAQVQTSMHMRKPWDGAAPASWLLAYSFNEDSLTEFKDSSSGNRPGLVRDGVFRGLIYGIDHKWKACPGTTLRNPERVCNNDVHVERGVCFQDKEEVSFNCDCNEGFSGPACQVECPGGWDNICSGHGKCFTTNDTFCVCDDGYAGEACQFLCPGFLHPTNRNNKECSGYGECQESSDGQQAECHCKASSNRYGAWCQFQQGQEPIIVDGKDCESCTGSNEVWRPARAPRRPLSHASRAVLRHRGSSVRLRHWLLSRWFGAFGRWLQTLCFLLCLLFVVRLFVLPLWQ